MRTIHSPRTAEAVAEGIHAATASVVGHDRVYQSDRDVLAARLAVLQGLSRSATAQLTVDVVRAREAGLTWDEVAEALGVTRSAVIQRFNRFVSPVPDSPRR